jgi:hypothetical protein
MKRWRVPVSALLATMVAGCGLVLLVPAPPASACSCVAGGPADYADWADAVFLGTLIDPPVDPPADAPAPASSDPAVYTFEVETVFEGEVGATAAVESARFGASCGLEGLRVGARYLMFTQVGRRADELSATLCGGSQLAKPGLVRRVEALTGSGTAPTRGFTARSTDGPASDGPSTDGPSSHGAGYLLVGFAAVVLAAVGWVLLPRGRRTVGGPT